MENSTVVKLAQKRLVDVLATNPVKMQFVEVLEQSLKDRKISENEAVRIFFQSMTSSDLL